jgi:hypothetical protein
MLTEEQKTDFRKAVDFWNGDKSGTLDCPLVSDNDDVAETQDTIDDFERSQGSAHPTATPWGDLCVWEGVQVAKGLRRGTSWVMDFGVARAAYFNGELP